MSNNNSCNSEESYTTDLLSNFLTILSSKDEQCDCCTNNHETDNLPCLPSSIDEVTLGTIVSDVVLIDNTQNDVVENDDSDVVENDDSEVNLVQNDNYNECKNIFIDEDDDAKNMYEKIKKIVSPVRDETDLEKVIYVLVNNKNNVCYKSRFDEINEDIINLLFYKVRNYNYEDNDYRYYVNKDNNMRYTITRSYRNFLISYESLVETVEIEVLNCIPFMKLEYSN